MTSYSKTTEREVHRISHPLTNKIIQIEGKVDIEECREYIALLANSINRDTTSTIITASRIISLRPLLNLLEIYNNQLKDLEIKEANSKYEDIVPDTSIDKAPFKIKYGGLNLTVRRMYDDEIIDEHTLYRCGDGRWLPSKAQGDQVKEHPQRTYVRMLSRGIEKFPEKEEWK